MDVPIFDEQNLRTCPDFRLVNVLRCLEGTIDVAKSVTSCMNILGNNLLNVIAPAFCVSRIPDDVHVFRASECMPKVFISQEMAHAIRKAKLTGLVMVKTRSV